MQNPSIPVGNEGRLFDTSPENHLSLPKIPFVAGADVSPATEAGERFAKKRFSVDAKRAIVFSLLVHALLAVMLLFSGGMQTQPQVVHQTMQATLVSWVHTPQSPEKTRVMDAAVPAAADQKEQALKTKTAVAVRPEVSPVPETKMDKVLNIEAKSAAVLVSDSPPAVSEEGAGDSKHPASSVLPTPSAMGLAAPVSHTSLAKPRYRENAPPSYPQSARFRGQEGVVLINAEILADGRTGVLKIKTSSGFDVLDRQALDAVRTWKFEPARRMGQAVSAWVDIPVRFVLKKHE